MSSGRPLTSSAQIVTELQAMNDRFETQNQIILSQLSSTEIETVRRDINILSQKVDAV